ncbi:5-hydroxytryptamine receptor 3E-like [Paramisgurnus dabryanus]|uniref:5-hydroxytryptamine receptor 3E-like n=1 Tax=Paramisgurnus dabryanus TaxID=90735 RepID=UPI003CCF41CD
MDILSLTTTCKMDLYRFPFDTQICSLTLQSLTYTDDQLKLKEGTDPKSLVNESKNNFQTEGEWDFLNLTTTTTSSKTLWVNRSRIVFQFQNCRIIQTGCNIINYLDCIVVTVYIFILQITIMRRSRMYIINLIFPVFCVLVLDVASFFIKASVADKLSFKVTLLLSISVLLLILHDKLPSTSSKIPLIGKST